MLKEKFRASYEWLVTGFFSLLMLCMAFCKIITSTIFIDGDKQTAAQLKEMGYNPAVTSVYSMMGHYDNGYGLAAFFETFVIIAAIILLAIAVIETLKKFDVIKFDLFKYTKIKSEKIEKYLVLLMVIAQLCITMMVTSIAGATSQDIQYTTMSYKVSTIVGFGGYALLICTIVMFVNKWFINDKMAAFVFEVIVPKAEASAHKSSINAANKKAKVSTPKKEEKQKYKVTVTSNEVKEDQDNVVPDVPTEDVVPDVDPVEITKDDDNKTE